MDSIGIARSLRKQLQGLGIDLGHAQVLELVSRTAGVKDWNTLSALAKACGASAQAPAPAAAPASGKPHTCPHCGKAGCLEVIGTGFVEQGECSGCDYEFEGDANHYRCTECNGQFLDWSSDIHLKEPHNDTASYVLLYRSDPRLPAHQRQEGSLYRLSDAVAALLDDGTNPRAELTRLLLAEQQQKGHHGDLVAALERHGREPVMRRSAPSRMMAMQHVEQALGLAPDELSPDNVIGYPD